MKLLWRINSVKCYNITLSLSPFHSWKSINNRELLIKRYEKYDTYNSFLIWCHITAWNTFLWLVLLHVLTMLPFNSMISSILHKYYCRTLKNIEKKNIVRNRLICQGLFFLLLEWKVGGNLDKVRITVIRE